MGMSMTTPTAYMADDCCADCGAGVSPHQADISREATALRRATGDSRNREGFVLCRRCLDRERQDNLETGWFAR